MTDHPRDAAADLAACEAATPDGFELGAIMNPDPEPGEGDFWHARTKFHRTVSKETAERYLRWCLLARDALPHWIARAQAAEQRLAAIAAVTEREHVRRDKMPDVLFALVEIAKLANGEVP